MPQGRSIYNGLQTKLEQQFAHNFTYLVAYTYSKTLSDAGDLLNGGSVSGYRAPSVPGLGPSFDWALGKLRYTQRVPCQRQLSSAYWQGPEVHARCREVCECSVRWLVGKLDLYAPGWPTYNPGLPDWYDFRYGLLRIKVPGQEPEAGHAHQHCRRLSWKAVLVRKSERIYSALQADLCRQEQHDCRSRSHYQRQHISPGLLSASGPGALGETSSTTTGPGYNQLDLSAFKGFQISERFSMQFRAELFNVLNHPNFNAPGFGGNGVVAIGNSTVYTNPNFGQVGATRSTSRQIQFALKLYY